MSMPIRCRLSTFALSAVVAGTLSVAVAGCSSDSSSGRYGRYGDYDHDRARTASERQGEINTRRADIEDDGRLNGTARSYEERKASRAADEGDRDAARREAELRRERLDR